MPPCSLSPMLKGSMVAVSALRHRMEEKPPRPGLPPRPRATPLWWIANSVFVVCNLIAGTLNRDLYTRPDLTEATALSEPILIVALLAAICILVLCEYARRRHTVFVAVAPIAFILAGLIGTPDSKPWCFTTGIEIGAGHLVAVILNGLLNRARSFDSRTN